MGIAELLKMENHFVNPFTDFGFKKLFGEEASKDILLDFLNPTLENGVGKITNEVVSVLKKVD